MKAIEYKIRRSRRKTLSLAIERDGSVLVRVPFGTSDSTVEDFIHRHRVWLNRKLEEYRPPLLDLSDGAELMLFGAPYTIGTGRTSIVGDRVYLPEEGREAALVRLLKRFVREVMDVFTARLARRYDFTYAGVRISSARTRWGSCSRDGFIHYTFRIAFLPTAVVEYIAIHELCHTVRFDHSAAFWREVESCLPDWRARRNALKEHSGLMNLL